MRKQSSTSLSGVSSAERDDVGARHHHVLDPHVVKRENVLEDGALLRRELLARALLDRVLDIVARRGRREAEQRPHALEQPRRLLARTHLQAASPALVRPLPSRSSVDDFARVGVGRPEPRHDPGLERLHALRLFVRLMIVADEMQKSMGDEMAIVVGERDAELVRLARQRLIGQRDIAERRRLPRSGQAALRERRARWSACRRRASAGSAPASAHRRRGRG